MTEEEWLSSTDPVSMLRSLAGGTSERKFRLFACACVRHVWQLVSDERSKSAVEIAERFAEGFADQRALEQARDRAREAAQHFSWPVGPDTAERAASVAQSTTRDSGRSAALNTLYDAARSMNAVDTNHYDDDEIEAQVALVRDIFGNPFQSGPFEPSWRTDDVVALGHSMYSSRAFDRMAELADALERAGCSDNSILDHCREPGEHVRGCWVMDLVLGKE